MNGIILLSIGLICVVIAVVAIILIKRQNILKHHQLPVHAHCVIGTNEQPTYLRLKKALPDCYILAQVAHAALLSASKQNIKHRIHLHHADFVVLDHKFKVLAIVDLNDASHKGKAARDPDRNQYLLKAGYKVVTYTCTPDIEAIKADFATQPPAYPDMYAEYYDDL